MYARRPAKTIRRRDTATTVSAEGGGGTARAMLAFSDIVSAGDVAGAAEERGI